MTPDNGAYAIAAYALTAILYVAYAVSLLVKERRLRARLAELQARAGAATAEDA